VFYYMHETSGSLRILVPSFEKLNQEGCVENTTAYYIENFALKKFIIYYICELSVRAIL